MHKLSEKDVAGLWLSGRLANLTDDLGNCIEVVCHGRVSTKAGCDFQDAVIRVNRQKVVGDIEVHLTSDLWAKHGHHKDAACNSVILHVALWQKGGLPVRLQDGRALPTVILSQYIINVYGAALRRREGGGAVPCLQGGGRTRAIDTILLIEGLRRLEERVAKFSDSLKTAGPGQVLYKGICRALGYSRNKAPFESLADRLPLSLIYRLAADNLRGKQAALLGAAGLLPSQGGMPGHLFGDHAGDLEDEWGKLSGRVASGSVSDWSLAFVRPVNHPLRRIAGLSCLLQRYEGDGLLQGLGRLAGNAGAAKSLAEGLQIDADSCDEYSLERHCELPQNRHCEERSDEAILTHSGTMPQIATPFGLAMTKGKRPAMSNGKGPAMVRGKTAPALIGRGRAGEIAVNVVLPFFAALARQIGDSGLENGVLDTYSCYPALRPNELTSYMSGVLLNRWEGKLNACHQQGLLRLYHQYCRVKDCECCPVFISRKKARV